MNSFNNYQYYQSLDKYLCVAAVSVSQRLCTYVLASTFTSIVTNTRIHTQENTANIKIKTKLQFKVTNFKHLFCILFECVRAHSLSVQFCLPCCSVNTDWLSGHCRLCVGDVLLHTVWLVSGTKITRLGLGNVMVWFAISPLCMLINDCEGYLVHSNVRQLLQTEHPYVTSWK